MEQIVFIQDKQPVTNSLKIAEVFQKGHDKVLRDIRSLKCSEPFRLANFGESSYKNQQGRIMPMFIVTFDGFAILAMGYSGERAMQFKERYIKEFNRTRQNLESHQFTLISIEQKQIQKAIASSIHRKFSHVPDKARRKYFSQLHSELKKMFGVSSFRDISRSDFQVAIDYIQKRWDSPNLESHRLEILS
ncbi:hypothetical protein BKP37_12870 [Anaerobacillus alkalilacustris]|uniref:Uncharacterized protein n=1 Tax=Anaerobacillus alkalilacustris TaxID=393763 RepID=A0A1S2LM05_9BACI|nr:hypothetical protein BKP37_12870 [Anaerobacillus alkalilacustris]